jgi:hypothetical protein
MQHRTQGDVLLIAAICAMVSASNPNLKYFSVWDAELSCPGPVSPRTPERGYFYYRAVKVACPGGCTIKVVSVASVDECQAACNATSLCAAVELDYAPSTNCTLLRKGGPGVGDATRDTYVRDLPTTRYAAALQPANLTCERAQQQWINFLFTSSDTVAIKRYHAAGLGPSLLYLRDTFFCGNKLCVDYKAKWAALRDSVVKPMLADKSIFGVFFGDELCWSCISWKNLSAAVDTVRADLPRGEAILYYNEAYPVFANNKCSTGGDFGPNRTNFTYPSVPAGLDWISLDYYPDEGTLLGVPKLFEQHVYPKMTAEQKALFVPPAYGCNTTACSNQLCCNDKTRDGANVPCNGSCPVAMLQWAKGSYDWARSDPRIVGLNPWHYTTRSAGPGPFEPGLSGMPAVFAAYKAIGKEIVSGRQGDIDFTQFGLYDEYTAPFAFAPTY